MSNFKCPMCTDCPDNCPLDSDTDAREHSADYYKGARDFAEWLGIKEEHVDAVLSEWQKGKENE